MSAATPLVIAIDGPAASGKGTIAAGVARELGFRYLDSGSLYRLVALKALRDNLPLHDEAALTDAAATLDVDFREGGLTLDGADATERIRSEAVSTAASQVAVHPAVRRALLSRQQAFRRPPGLVAEGRDMGTVVFPDARYKVFLTASAGERAERRYKQLKQKGLKVKLVDLLNEIEARDRRDAARAVAPLKPAADAVVVDSTGIPIAAVVDSVLAVVAD